MQMISAKLFRNRLILAIFDRTTEGVGHMSSAFVAEDPADLAAVGRDVRLAISRSKDGVEPPPWEALRDMPDPALELSGVKSRSTMMKTAKSVSVDADGSQFTIRPYTNRGPRGGFTSIEDKARILNDPDDAALGAALFAAFADTA